MLTRTRNRELMAWTMAVATAIRIMSIPMTAFAAKGFGIPAATFAPVPAIVTLGTVGSFMLLAVAGGQTRRLILALMGVEFVGCLILGLSGLVRPLGAIVTVAVCALGWFLCQLQSRSVEALENLYDRSHAIQTSLRRAQGLTTPVVYAVLVPIAATVAWLWQPMYLAFGLLIGVGLLVMARSMPTTVTEARPANLRVALPQLLCSPRYILGVVAAFSGRTAHYLLLVGIASAGCAMDARGLTRWSGLVLAGSALTAWMLPRMGRLSIRRPIRSLAGFGALGLVGPVMLLAANLPQVRLEVMAAYGAHTLVIPTYVVVATVALAIIELSYQSGQLANRIMTRQEDARLAIPADSLMVGVRDVGAIVAGALATFMCLTYGEVSCWVVALAFAALCLAATGGWVCLSRR